MTENASAIPATPAEGASRPVTFAELWKFCEAERVDAQAWLDVAVADDKGARVVTSLSRKLRYLETLVKLVDTVASDQQIVDRLREIKREAERAEMAAQADLEGGDDEVGNAD